MDIANLVNYEQEYPVELKFGGKPVGITIWVVSFDSERVVKAVRDVAAERWVDVQAAGSDHMTPQQNLEFNRAAERAQLVSAISKWDFGGNSFGDLGKDPECNEENRKYLIGHQNARWIREQLVDKGTAIENFTNLPGKRPARK